MGMVYWDNKELFRLEWAIFILSDECMYIFGNTKTMHTEVNSRSFFSISCKQIYDKVIDI